MHVGSVPEPEKVKPYRALMYVRSGSSILSICACFVLNYKQGNF